MPSNGRSDAVQLILLLGASRISGNRAPTEHQLNCVALKTAVRASLVNYFLVKVTVVRASTFVNLLLKVTLLVNRTLLSWIAA